MTTNNSISTLRNIVVRNCRGMAVLAAALALTGCAGVSLTGNASIPAAEANARYGVTQNDNTRIVLKVKHLAHPSRLTPPANNYVVWTRVTKDAPAQNIGELKVDDNLNGELDAETPLHSFELFITAEASGQVQQPTGQFLFYTSYTR